MRRCSGGNGSAHRSRPQVRAYATSFAFVRMDELVRRYLADRNDPREVTADPHARYFGTEPDERSLLPGDGARVAATTFEEWLKESILRGRAWTRSSGSAAMTRIRPLRRLFRNPCERSQRFVHRLRVRKYLRHIRIQDDDRHAGSNQSCIRIRSCLREIVFGQNLVGRDLRPARCRTFLNTLPTHWLLHMQCALRASRAGR